jgi:hypothetical protein
MGNHTVRGKYACALNTLKGSDRDSWLAQCNANGPALTDQHNTEAQKLALFVASVDLLLVHVLKEDSAGNYQK